MTKKELGLRILKVIASLAAGHSVGTYFSILGVTLANFLLPGSIFLVPLFGFLGSLVGSAAGSIITNKGFDYLLSKVVDENEVKQDEVDNYIDKDDEFKKACDGLGVLTTESVAEIKKVAANKFKRFHPDKQRDKSENEKKEAQEKFN
jgi:hypothetical protein